MRNTTLDLTGLGWAVTAAIGLLVVLGLACIYVTDTHYVAGDDGPRNAAKQLVFVLAGIALSILVLKMGYPAISRHAYTLFLVALAGLVPLFIARMGHHDFGGVMRPINGAYRWIRLPGFQLQPSEFMKVAYLLALAWYLRYRQNYRRFSGLLVPFLASAVPLALILVEPDLGTVLLLLPVLFAMLFIAGARIRHLLIIVMIALAAAPLMWWQIKGYQRLRVTAVLLQSPRLRQAVIEHPEAYPALISSKRQAIEWAASSGYQLVHSKNAIGSGGLLGYGWGNGIYVNNSLLPDRHNDFVLSIIGHQWGFAGCLLALGCYAVFVIAGARIASVTRDPFGRLLAVGVVVLIATQVLINVGMSVGLMPITGMTLPFVSYGGSSLLTNFVAAALLISVAQHRPYLLATSPFEFARRKRKENMEVTEFGKRPPVDGVAPNVPATEPTTFQAK